MLGLAQSRCFGKWLFGKNTRTPQPVWPPASPGPWLFGVLFTGSSRYGGILVGHFLTVCPWPHYLMSHNLDFLIYKMGMITGPVRLNGNLRAEI